MMRRSAELDEIEEPTEAERPTWRERLSAWVLRHPKDAIALFAAVVGCGTIAVNALWLQSGPHPAPLFSLSILSTGAPADHAPDLPRPRPPATDAAPAVPIPVPAPRSRAELIAEVQRELAKRGLYDGSVDGIYGPKTDASVRDFAQVTHLKVGAEPTEALLQSIRQSGLHETRPAPAASMSRGRHDAISDLIGPSSRILAVQRALADFGYGQIKPTGVLGPDTVAAIEKFERARQLPVTGQISDRLTRELAAVTGRPRE
jgi:peptidoglycan hydrolase-like protein with peptidoglycan-binding domain